MFVVVGSFPIQLENSSEFVFKTFCEYVKPQYWFDIDVVRSNELSKELEHLTGLKMNVTSRPHDKSLNFIFDETDYMLVSNILHYNKDNIDDIVEKYHTHNVYLVNDNRISITEELIDLETNNEHVRVSGLGSNSVRLIICNKIDPKLKSFLILKYNITPVK